MTVEEVEVNVRQIDEGPEGEPPPLAVLLQRVMLAGIGVVALTYDEMEKLLDRLVERGELAQQDAEKLLREMTERVRQGVPQEIDPGKASTQAAQAQEQVGARIDSGLEQVLNSLNIPSKRDIDELSTRIAQLAARIEHLQQPAQPVGGTAAGSTTKGGASKKEPAS
jgi:poly(hydroxyalkanoate) granule-associated protein